MSDSKNNPDSDQRYVYMNQANAEDMAKNKTMPKNLINTAKYNVFNFIPMNLFN